MSQNKRPAGIGTPQSVVGPDGKILTLDDLPPPSTQRSRLSAQAPKASAAIQSWRSVAPAQLEPNM